MTVNLTEAQADLFGLGRKKRRPAAEASLGQMPRTQPKPAKPKRTKAERALMPENQVVAPITQFLELKGWWVKRQQSGLFNRPFAESRQPIRVGTKGALDWVCIRPLEMINVHQAVTTAEYFEIEMKGKGNRPSADQETYMRDCHARGITAVWFDSYHEFVHWYRARFPGEVTQF